MAIHRGDLLHQEQRLERPLQRDKAVVIQPSQREQLLQQADPLHLRERPLQLLLVLLVPNSLKDPTKLPLHQAILMSQQLPLQTPTYPMAELQHVPQELAPLESQIPDAQPSKIPATQPNCHTLLTANVSTSVIMAWPSNTNALSASTGTPEEITATSQILPTAEATMAHQSGISPHGVHQILILHGAHPTIRSLSSLKFHRDLISKALLISQWHLASRLQNMS